MSRQTLAVWLSEQRWLPYKTRRSVIKRIHPAMLRDFAFETEFFGPGSGLRFTGNIVNYIDRLIYFCGAHEKYMLTFLRDYVQRRRTQEQHKLTFVDVGANAGNHALFMASLVDEVHAFEPFERVRQQMQVNLTLNQMGNVRVHPFGLSNRDAVEPFYAAPGTNLGAASFVAAHKEDNYYLGDMQLKRGDDVMAEEGIKVDILKADVEGYEKFVLEGLRDTLMRDRPLCIIELSPTTRQTLGDEAGLKALFPADYEFYYFARGTHDKGSYRLAPFDYKLMPKIQDVIACPRERLACLN
jgi:FkbM family methyltransferase